MNCVNPPVPGYAYEALRAQVASLDAELATRTQERDEALARAAELEAQLVTWSSHYDDMQKMRDEARAQLAQVTPAFAECYDLIRNLVRSQHVGDATALRSASRKHAALYAACTAPPEGGAPDG